MRSLLACVFTFAALHAQQAPKVVTLDPPQEAEVDSKTTKRLTVTFDQPMNTGGFSFCGGGPSFPKTTGRPQWKDEKTIVVDVELEPDHEYTLGLNAPSATNFRSAGGATLVPVRWSFTTLPAKVRPAAEQRRRNQQALDVLMKTLAERYSYHELRVDDWQALEKEHAPAVLAAKTDRGFAAAAAAMLKPTQDLHLYLRLGEQTFGTGSRAVDPLFRRPLLDRYVSVQQAGKQALAGRTDDGVGYLLIGAWSNELDLEAIGSAIVGMADTKAMVVDVRPNSGGDERLAQQVAAWFVTGTVTYAKHRTRLRAGKDGFGPVEERRLTGHGPERHYGKPVAVLTSRYVMSSNESFVKMMAQAKDCVVVGQPTYGSSGNPKPFELGNGVTVFVPSWQDMGPDGALLEGEGFAPDEFVPCTPDDLQSRDPILEKALELLRAKVKEAK